MICTVSTVKDSIHNVVNFIQRNLAAGADHMFIFLEGGDRAVLQFLNDHRHVTVVDADEMHQVKRQSASLNTRQTTNANRINYLLAGIDSARWLFHIDGDECLDIDKERLLNLGPEIAYVRLTPKESVSAPEAMSDDAVHFKRLLSDDELALLTVLGLIDAPHNRRYFQGHVSGKVGIRPSMEYGLHIHEASRPQGEEPQEFQADWLSLLHYESFTPEEFVRKWSVHIAAGSQTRFRQDKEIVRGAITGVLNNTSIDANQKRQYLLDIYRRRVEDDVPTLLQLGLLEKVDHQRKHNPCSFSVKEASRITGVLPELLAAKIGYFRPRQLEHDPLVLMKEIYSKVDG